MLMTRTKKRTKPGLAPGTLESSVIPSKELKIAVISYSPDEIEEKKVNSIDECRKYIGNREVTWIDIDVTQNVEILNQVGEKLGIHPLALEDTIESNQRPKLEDFGEYLYIVLRYPRKRNATSHIESEQINMFLGKNFVITIHDSENIFEPVIHRIKEGKGRARKMKSDYLAYALVDLIVDQHFPVMEMMAEQIEELEEEIQKKATPDIVIKIRQVKRDLINIRSSIWPMREVINSMEREAPELLTDATKLFLRDAYDHTIQIVDIVESYRDVLSEMFNIYLSVKADNTNEVMKILTIFATIFIPLTFAVGIYGMNFEFMPELKWKYSYFILHGIMIIISLAMLRFFRKRGWLGGKKK